MNKVLFRVFIYFFLLGIGSLESSVAVRAAAFFPASKRFRHIYGDVNVDYQIEVCSELIPCLDAWVNFDWFSKHGKSQGAGNSTEITIANTSVGIRFTHHFCGGFAYLGIGDNFSGVWIKNKSSCSHKKFSKSAMGGVLKAGLDYYFNGCAFLGIFVDYLYQPIHFQTHVNIGGFKTGVELGVKF